MKLYQLPVCDFIKQLGSGDPTPGGGSVAALCGALGTALTGMVSRLTVGKEKYRTAWEKMEEIKKKADEMADQFLKLAQDDTDAYQQVMCALKLPKETDKEKSHRRYALQKAMKNATRVPLETLKSSEDLIKMANTAVKFGNPNTLTDAGAAVHMAHAAAAVAAYNVQINLGGIKDDLFCNNCRKQVGETLDRIEALFIKSDEYVKNQLT